MFLFFLLYVVTKNATDNIVFMRFLSVFIYNYLSCCKERQCGVRRVLRKSKCSADCSLILPVFIIVSSLLVINLQITEFLYCLRRHGYFRFLLLTLMLRGQCIWDKVVCSSQRGQHNRYNTGAQPGAKKCKASGATRQIFLGDICKRKNP